MTQRRRIKLSVSDLHMGFGRVVKEGTINDMEDFVGDQALIDMLEYYRAGEFVDAEVEMILNGDIFEGLVPYGDDDAPDLISAKKSVAKIGAIVEAHREVFAALATFQRGEHRQVTFVVGNHDQDLLWEEVRELLRERVHPEINFVDDVYRFEGVHLEHGHNHEHQNRVDPQRMFLTRGLPEPVLKLPWGSDMFINVLLPIKRVRPYINRVRPARLFFSWAFWHDLRALLRFFWTFIAALFVARFRRQRQRRITFWQTLRVIFGGSAFPTLEAEARRVLEADAALHTVVFGHTHVPMWRQLAPGKTYVNSGSWIPTSNLHISQLGLQQRQTYVYLEHEEGVWRARLKLWHGRRVVEEDIPL
ncbi:MAG: hypothetical protein CSA24_00370 [Deltaproteobacteria bacterium]|nr:MAG: hypothetical protein CSB49_03030 [Pseudomonadota bacterium]PIE66350.1 MAG: hypothetical protein CSA24_00370 [Deltaproteobacteria bacterium]